ncbi:hypothetical protein C8R41DRAFT_920214 [Lentinula lateritia]|uniref:Uncharacterized protein n=1 Tax=Lentinula lateritia TaxID=40482 RepID=A0ABQ8VIE7_9AGAR|nr:hypothetical protein C8R41DRAFT_920214 [Lentinula lateritia]
MIPDGGSDKTPPNLVSSHRKFRTTVPPKILLLGIIRGPSLPQEEITWIVQIRLEKCDQGTLSVVARGHKVSTGHPCVQYFLSPSLRPASSQRWFVDLPVCFSLDSVFLPVRKYLLLDRFSGVLLNKPIAYSTSHPSSPLPALRLFAMWYRILPSTFSPSQLSSICLLFSTVLLSVSAIAIPSGSVSASQQHQKQNGESTTSSKYYS